MGLLKSNGEFLIMNFEWEELGKGKNTIVNYNIPGKVQAASSMGTNNYAYDTNGNMISRKDGSLDYDSEDHLIINEDKYNAGLNELKGAINGTEWENFSIYEVKISKKKESMHYLPIQ